MALPVEPEITAAADLCTGTGRLNPAAVGWTRTPRHRANLRGWGRAKRWEYWAVQAPGHVLALTVSSIDYLALHTVWFMSYEGQDIEKTVMIPFGKVQLPHTSGGGPIHVAHKDLDIRIEPDGDGVNLRCRTDRIHAEVDLARPFGHQSLGVVIPWSERRFQYTVKENTLPARGWVRADGVSYDFEPETSYGVLDHGRGKWPYRITWNWGSGSGVTDDVTLGLQFGGKWTDGTGMTENALCVDGRLDKISEDLRWQYDRADWMRPWRVRAEASGRVDLTFTPAFERKAHTQALVIATEVHQCFGTWSGQVVTTDGRIIDVADVRGFAEEARMRW
jgi:hypothetical protein